MQNLFHRILHPANCVLLQTLISVHILSVKIEFQCHDLLINNGVFSLAYTISSHTLLYTTASHILI
jgi:hypothetical protein